MVEAPGRAETIAVAATTGARHPPRGRVDRFTARNSGRHDSHEITSIRAAYRTQLQTAVPAVITPFERP
jgi:hypothetical protein